MCVFPCVSVCVCRFQLSPRFAVAVKCCPPGEVLAAAPFSVSCSSSFCQGHQDQQRQWIPLSPLSMLCQHHQHCATPTPPASARLSLCTSQPSLRSQRDAPLVRSDTLLGFFFFLSLSLSHSLRQLPSSSFSLFCSSKGTCCVEVTLSRPQLQSQGERKEVERERERDRTLFQGVEKGREGGREDEPAFCSLAECTTSLSHPVFFLSHIPLFFSHCVLY